MLGKNCGFGRLGCNVADIDNSCDDILSQCLRFATRVLRKPFPKLLNTLGKDNSLLLVHDCIGERQWRSNAEKAPQSIQQQISLPPILAFYPFQFPLLFLLNLTYASPATIPKLSRAHAKSNGTSPYSDHP